MSMTLEDSQLLKDLCEQHSVNADKVLKLLDAVATASSRTSVQEYMTCSAKF